MTQTKSLRTQSIIQIAIVFTLMLGIKSLADYFNIMAAGSITIWFGIILATYFMKRDNISWKSVGLKLPKGGKDWLINVGLALLAVIATFLLMGLVLDPIMTHFGLEKPDDIADRFQFFLGKPLVFIAYLVTVVWFGAAMGEELLMRGFLLNKLTNVFGGDKLGIILALISHAIIFGMLHIYQGLPGIISTGFAGLILGIIYFLGKKRLFPVILGHALINTISLTAFYLMDGVVN